MGRWKHGYLALLVVVACAVAVFALIESPGASAVAAEPQRRSRQKPKPRPAEMKFSHSATAHQLACSFCHEFPSANWNKVRTGDSAIPDITDFPQHSSCLKCHKEQFFARERPAPRICAVCHVGVTPKFTERHPFPNPVEAFHRSPRGRDFVSAFDVAFPHESHLELLGGADSCVQCHATIEPQGEGGDEYSLKPPADLGDGFWLKKGTFKTSPSGHATCFACHAVDSGMKPEPRDCAICHRLRTRGPAAADFDPKAAATLAAENPAIRSVWRERNSSATFRHEGGLHTDVACTKCHDVSKIDTTDPMSQRVRILSCGGDSGCHITATADEGGALNFELLQRKSDPGFRCTKCHLAYAGSPIPASHSGALPGATTE